MGMLCQAARWRVRTVSGELENIEEYSFRNDRFLK
jgi:hypothetical protein